MIPVRDVIPTRTRPVVTLAALAGLCGALAWPPVRAWWLPWVFHALVVWLFGRTVEDRLGHGRFVALLLACVASSTVVGATAGLTASAGAAVAAAVAGTMAAYFLMFPRSRVLALVPVLVGVELTEVPAWFIAGLWGAVQAFAISSFAAWSGSPGEGTAAAVGVAAGAVAGAVAWLVLRRPERMRVEWWDGAR